MMLFSLIQLMMLQSSVQQSKERKPSYDVEMVKEGERMGLPLMERGNVDSAKPLLSLFASALPSGCQRKLSLHVSNFH